MRTLAQWLQSRLGRLATVAPTFAGGALFGFALAVSVGESAHREPPTPAVTASDARLIEEVLSKIGTEYVDSVDVHALLRHALAEMVAGLDPYSALLDEEAYDALRARTSGEYSGIGVDLTHGRGHVEIAAVHDKSPAQRAGIKVGDRLLALDGHAFPATATQAASAALRGAPGTVVKLTLTRDGSTAPFVLAVTRGPIHMHTVAGTLLAPGVGYLRVTYFNDSTAGEVAAAMKRLERTNAAPLEGLVLDLRGNPGGVLEAGIAVADAFLNDGIIVRSVGRGPEANFVARAAPGGDVLAGRPLAVLIDAQSASAAEIVASALKENHRALILGRKSYGKASVQTIMPLEDGGALRLTTARYYGPGGLSLAGHGLEPDEALEPAAVDVGADPMRAALLAGGDSEVTAAIAALDRAHGDGLALARSDAH